MLETNSTISIPEENADKFNSETKSSTSTGNKWTRPKPFEDEPVEMQVSMILKWIFAGDKYEKIMTGSEKLTNITTRLEKMKYNGYLRLFEIDMNIVKEYMTDSSWILYQDFKKKRERDAWKCPLCTLILEQNASNWKCHRCLFHFHEKCSKPMKTKLNGNSGESISLCSTCLFAL